MTTCAVRSKLSDKNLRRLVIVSALALGCGAAAGCSSPATKHACDVLTEGEIAKVFGGTVSERKREATHASSQCDYEVSADGERPPGFVTVRVVFAGAKTAYDDLQKPGSGYTPIPELSNALSNEALRIVEVLSSDVLVSVQAIFVENILEPVPPQFHEVHGELLELTRLAVKGL